MHPRLAALPPTLALALALAAPAPAGAAAYLVLQVEDAPGQGFNDATSIAPAGGNPATTLGAARLRALEFAAGLWADRLDSPVPIEVAVRFEPLGGTATFATLGLGGPADVYRDFAGAPQPATWYPAALADRLAGTDLDGGGAPDLEVVFNLDVDGPQALGEGRFYYGLDGHPPSGDVSFVQVALHEIGHGLGFTSQLNLATGAKLLGYDDVYMSWVERLGAAPPDLPSMSNAERLDALRSGPELRWVGPRLAEASAGLTAGADAQGRVELYAPPQVTISTLHHFATALEPDDVMEPFYAEGAWDLTLARALLGDLGWGGPPGCVTPGTPELGIVWIDDYIPAGSTPQTTSEEWLWIGREPYSGAFAHYSASYPTVHQHWFYGATETLQVEAGDTLFVYVRLTAADLPQTVMLQFRVGSSWVNRAYWGLDRLTFGPRVRIGDLPPAGEWVRLEVPGSALGLEGTTLNGLAFSLYGGRAAWDVAGVIRAGGQEVAWIDDAPPAGATLQTEKERWVWAGADAQVVSGEQAHHSAPHSGIHQHYFQSSPRILAVGPDDTLYSYVYLDPDDPPSTVMLQFNDGSSWNHRAYWGANNIPWGADGTIARKNLGPLPPTGEWVRLEVPPAEVGLANLSINGLAFALFGGKAVWDVAGLLPGSEEVVWCDDALPPGATPQTENDSWTWISSNPTPVVGTQAHTSGNVAGVHQHWFTGAASGLPVNQGDTLYAWVYIDPASPPQTLMFQWQAWGTWNYRAYWGADRLTFGTRVSMGPLPPVGEWVRLEVPASLVGLEGKVVTGMAFSLYDGKVTFDAAGLLRAGV